MSHLLYGWCGARDTHIAPRFFLLVIFTLDITFQLFSSNTRHVCRYYYSETKPLEATLAMDDFSYHGWKMADSVVNLSLDHILCAG